MKISRGWFLLGSFVTATVVTIRFMAEWSVKKFPELQIVVGITDVFLLLSAISAFTIFYQVSKNRWFIPQKETGYSSQTYSFSNGVITVWAAFLIATMIYKLSGLSG